MATAIYPGSFDPITYGHINLIERGLKIFDKLVIGVACNVRKAPLFTAEERIEMIRASLPDAKNIEIDTFEGLLIDYAKKQNSRIILRGLRALSDFEFEFQLAHMNARLGASTPDGIETIFMMTGEEHFYVSSSLVREISSFGGDISGLVPQIVEDQLKQKFANAPN